jgi:cytochrome oxidase Cu insertion factor (SCO1/SenC/PrrC family)
MTLLTAPPSTRAWPFALALDLALIGLTLAGCRGDAGRSMPEPPPVATAGLDLSATTASKVAECCEPTTVADTRATSTSKSAETRKITIPDVTVLDQDGKEVRLYSDLVKGKVVAINFVFTTCKAACPLLGAGFSKFQETLGDRLGTEVSLISISVDPMVDRPDRLKEWAGRFGARPGWTFVTSADGRKAELDALLKALQVYSPEKSDHAQSVLVVDGDSLEGRTSRKLAAPEELEAMVGEAIRIHGGRSYFTDTTLVDQEGRRYRFYSDLLKGRVVVIHPFFTACKGSCPVMSGSLARLQERLGDRLGKDVLLLSLTVDPATDNIEELAGYAKRCGARAGWHFLTGTKDDLTRVERKLGQYVENREGHTSIMIVGNEATGLWLKHQDPADADGLFRKVEEALADDPAAKTSDP